MKTNILAYRMRIHTCTSCRTTENFKQHFFPLLLVLSLLQFTFPQKQQRVLTTWKKTIHYQSSSCLCSLLQCLGVGPPSGFPPTWWGDSKMPWSPFYHNPTGSGLRTGQASPPHWLQDSWRASSPLWWPVGLPLPRLMSSGREWRSRALGHTPPSSLGYGRRWCRSPSKMGEWRSFCLHSSCPCLAWMRGLYSCRIPCITPNPPVYDKNKSKVRWVNNHGLFSEYELKCSAKYWCMW